MWVALSARRVRRANPRSAMDGRADAEEPTSTTVETVRPGKALASSQASSAAPGLAGEAQSVVCLEKTSDWLSSSPGTQSGREVLSRKLGEQRRTACGTSGGGRETERIAEWLTVARAEPRR